MTFYNTDHLDAIDLRLSHERARVETAKNVKEREWRQHNVKMIEQERDGEIAFLAKRGIVVKEMSIDEIFTEMEELGL